MIVQFFKNIKYLLKVNNLGKFKLILSKLILLNFISSICDFSLIYIVYVIVNQLFNGDGASDIWMLSILNLSIENNSIVLAVIFSILSIISFSSKFFSIKVNNNFNFNFSFEIFKNIIINYFNQKYINTLNDNNSSKIISLLYQKVSILNTNIIGPLLNIIFSLFTFGMIIISLFVIEPKTIFVILISFLIFLSYFYLKNRYNIDHKKENVSKLLTENLKNLNELFLFEKYIFLNHGKEFLINRTLTANKKLRDEQMKNSISSTIPKIFYESIFYFLILIVFIYLSFFNTVSTEILAILSSFLFAFQRILPILNSAHHSLSLINVNSSYLNDYANIHKSIVENFDPSNSHNDIVLFKDNISFQNIKFRYSNMEKYNLVIDNLIIKKGARVLILGPSGSGKSTFLNLLSGNLIPEMGTISVDGKILEFKNYKSWRMNVAILPQNSITFNSSIYSNITFKEDLYYENDEFFKKVVSNANISEFVNDVDESYLSIVFENSTNLSGGQNQRIVLGRALYRNSKILILDEPTSALDTANQSEIISSILNGFSKDQTIFVTTHDVSLIKFFDHIIYLDSDGIISSKFN